MIGLLIRAISSGVLSECTPCPGASKKPRVERDSWKGSNDAVGYFGLYSFAETTVMTTSTVRSVPIGTVGKNQRTATVSVLLLVALPCLSIWKSCAPDRLEVVAV